MEKNNWHAQNNSQVLSAVKSSIAGLSTVEAKHRLQIDGSNELELFKPPSIIIRFLRQFHNILIYVLLFSAAITLLLGYLVDTGVILGVVVINAIFGFIQEGKAEEAIAAIRHMLVSQANVVRDGKHFIIPAKELVKGDTVLIKSGDKVPADLRLLETKNLQIQEAILTGESHAIEKNVEPVSVNASLGDRINVAYSGTTIICGKGTGVVVATGIHTEIGKISGLLKSIQPITTPLLRQMNVFGRWLTLAILVLATFTFLVGVLFWRDSVEQLFMVAVWLAVAAIPEGLPPILTVILAIGVTRMAKRRAIIRQLPAVETMGAVSTICTDKTGTLTRNEQTVQHIITSQNSYDVTDDSTVVFNLDKKVITLRDHAGLWLAINAAILCNDARFSKDERDRWHIHGNPTDKALLELGGKVKIDLELLQKEYPRSDLIPYESEHKFMATLHHSHDNKAAIYIKGAPEDILTRCTYERINGEGRPLSYDYWVQHINTLAQLGYRVIAIAVRAVSPDKRTLLFEDALENLTLVAIFGLMDAPRAEVAQAIEQCNSAKIKVKMITGDHAATARTIASQVGIDSHSGVLTGSDIDKMSDSELAQVVKDINVYARTSPQHKLRLVQALQTNGELVAMTGDGVNDAPALRKANIGVAMGHKGAEITKESAAMVIADDNFVTIVHAIEEGRIVYDNLRKVILHMLPTNAAQALILVLAIVLGFMLPVTPVQILWVNMITTVVLSTALGFEQPESDVMRRPPRKAQAAILSGFLVWRTIFVTILFVICVFGLFMLQYHFFGVSIIEARTIAVNMLVFSEAMYLLNCRKLFGPMWNVKTLFNSKLILIAIASILMLQLSFTYLPLMQKFFGTAAINFKQWLYIILLSLGVFVFVEFEKFFLKKFMSKSY
ncbi:MAG: HAD-IC family P-type ATPase [Coxiellaceae bacterium]|jgi:calcium-translocating P-type ATPase|nr:HAD-IC family P-type ATPase [Coxiellaceae bacterium]